MWLLFIGLVIASLIVSMVLGLVLVRPGLLLLFAAERTTLGTVRAAVGGLILLAIFLVLSGAIGTFLHAYWTLAYLRFAEPPAAPVPAGGPEYPPAGNATTA